MLFKIQRKKENRIIMKKTYGFNNESRERAMSYSTQKPTQRNFESRKSVGGGA